MRNRVLPSFLIVWSVITSGADGYAAQGVPSTWPREHSVARDVTTGLLSISTPYYVVTHDPAQGGAIAAIAYPNGRAQNLLVRPISTWVRDANGTRFSDCKDSRLRFSSRAVGGDAPAILIVSAESELVDPQGRASGIRVKTVYEYHWGYIKIRKEMVFPAEPVRVQTVCVLSTVVASSLSDYGYREGLSEEDGAGAFSFGSCRWAKMRASDPPFKTQFVPRYMVFAEAGVEGFEWCAASDLPQWEVQLAGRRGQGLCSLEWSNDPAGLALSLCPFNAGETAIALTGVHVFDYYIGMPLIEGRAQKPWFHTSFNRNKGNWVSAEAIKAWANTGIQTVHCHNDGDYYDDGLFWRDGSYPPYPPADMARYNQVIDDCHRAGIRVATYFSNKELHSSTKEFQEHGQEWGRKDARGKTQRNIFRGTSEFGVQMCLKSGWLEYLKLCIDRVLANHPLDGVYYDWNVALYCLNPLHGGPESRGAAQAGPQAGHWDIDELLSLMEWTRRRVGPNGLIIVHNTTTPMFAIENFADHVVAMEWGYKKWSEESPPFQDLPLEWNFVGARSRGVISYGHIDAQAPRRLHRLFAIESLLSGVTPWPASPETFEVFPLLKPLGELYAYRFADWRQTAVRLAGNRVASALYSRPGETYALLANLDKNAQEVRCVVQPSALPFPLKALSSATVRGNDAAKDGDRSAASLDVEKLTGDGVTITLPPDTVRILQLK